MEVKVESLLEPNLQKQIVQWNDQELQEQLPLAPGDTACLPLHLYGAANFLAHMSTLQGKYLINKI